MGEGGHSNNIPCNKFSAEVSQNLLEPLSVSQWGLIKSKEDVFYNLQTIVGRFLDIDHLLALFVQIPKQDTVKSAENKITKP
jgi:hypothetical protein